MFCILYAQSSLEFIQRCGEVFEEDEMVRIILQMDRSINFVSCLYRFIHGGLNK